MTGDPLLLTIVLESPDTLDREGVTYRRLLSARLKWEQSFEIRTVEGPLSFQDIRELSESIDSSYIVFIRSDHEISSNYTSTLISYLSTRTVYLAEPMVYTGKIPKAIDVTAGDPYTRDTDLYGIAFRTARLREMFEAVQDVDRSGIYLAYRLYWSIGSVTPIQAGYSTASDTKAAIGLYLAEDTQRLVPLLSTSSRQLRVYILRYLVLYLRGLRAEPRSSVSFAHLRELVKMFSLTELLQLSSTLQPFETAWIRWIDDTSEDSHLYKRLSDKDAYLTFALDPAPLDADIELYVCRLGDDTLRIGKAYRSTALRPGRHDPKVVDFYRHPITPESILLFFDRPMQADDNAEHLYAYFQRAHPEYENIYFALNRKSPDWERLEQAGFRLVQMFSPEFRELFLASDAVVSSQIYNLAHRGKNLSNSRFVYLQHGIQLNDMSDWVLSKYFDVFVATGKLEADYLGALAPVETLNSGLPRMESLRRRPAGERRILFMPTWRFNLHQLADGTFARSEYFHAIDSLLTDRRLLAFLDEQDITLHVKLHPNVMKRAHLFHFSDRVVLTDMSYREAFETAEFVFTDYSSAVLDAAFITTPIAYYQWDAEGFFEDQPYESRLDYVTEGLGPVYTEHDDIVSHIVEGEYTASAEAFAQRRHRFFEGVDPERINATIAERILSL